MPILEYECSNGHVSETFFKSISEGEHTPTTVCPLCGLISSKIFSAPLGFGLYGNPEGYSKPSTSRRFNTKTVSQKMGNASSVS